MQPCQTRQSTFPTLISTSTSVRRTLPAATSRLPSSPRSAATSTSRKGRSEGFEEIIVRVGPGKGRKVRFVGVLLGEWVAHDSQPRRKLPRLAEPHRQVRPPHRAQRGLLDGQRGRQTSRLAGIPGDRQRQLRIVAGRPIDRDHRHPRGAPREGPATALRHGRPRC